MSLREEPGHGIRTIAGKLLSPSLLSTLTAPLSLFFVAFIGEIFDETMAESNDGPTGQFMISLLSDDNSHN